MFFFFFGVVFLLGSYSTTKTQCEGRLLPVLATLSNIILTVLTGTAAHLMNSLQNQVRCEDVKKQNKKSLQGRNNFCTLKQEDV